MIIKITKFLYTNLNKGTEIHKQFYSHTDSSCNLGANKTKLLSLRNVAIYGFLIRINST